MGLHGSPSDYAWGPQGLENIISQMLANLEDDGAPPTDKEKLEALPTVEVTAEDLKECELESWFPYSRLVLCLLSGVLCSVCKDDFSASEKLVKLPCTHLYHKDCILPWLEMVSFCDHVTSHVIRLLLPLPSPSPTARHVSHM